MSQPRVTIRLDGTGRVYRSGEALAGEYRLESIAPDQIKAIEVSVLWYSEGKGDEDLAVHYFRRLEREDGDWVDPGLPGRFSTTLPNSPLSYNGLIVKIVWCVRVRVFLVRGKQVLGEQSFRLGNVPAAVAERGGQEADRRGPKTESRSNLAAEEGGVP
jgi:hypothetical protein